MRRALYAICLIVLVAGSVFAMKKVNGREVPEKEDFTSMGNSVMQAMDQVDTLLSELANTLGTTEGSDVISVNKVITDSIRSNPNIDSCALSKVSGAVAFSGTITCDSLLGTDVVRGNPNIDSCALSKVSGAVAFSGTVTCDSILGTDVIRGAPNVDSIMIGDSKPVITSIDTLANDTLVIIIGGNTIKLAL